ncbi:MAG: DUF4397 domain-containing protein [Pedobacter sp.]|nr:MAG: DUF4397 domain-containing protein [Pedobacter sp.]
MKISLRIKTLLTALVITLGLASCSKNEYDNTPIYISGLSLIHASPTAEKFDVYVDRNRASIDDFSFGTKMDYLNAYAGNRTFQVAKKGNSTTLLTKEFTLEAEYGYSLFIVNKLENLELLFLKDDLTIPAASKAKVRFVNLSPDAAALNYAINGQATDLASNRAFKEYSEFITIDAAEKVTFNVKDATGVVIAALTDVKIESGKTYTVYAKGLKANTDDTKFGAAIFTHK